MDRLPLVRLSSKEPRSSNLFALTLLSRGSRRWNVLDDNGLLENKGLRKWESLPTVKENDASSYRVIY